MAQEVQLKFNSENRDREEILDACQNTYIEMLKPPEWLEGLESPFKWGLYLKRREFVNWNIQEKLGDYTNQGAFYGFEKLAFYLVYIFLGTTGKEMFKLYERDTEEEESSADDDNSSEEEYDHDPERAYVKCSDILAEMALNNGDIMYTRIGPALQHVLQATRAHMLYFNKNIAESQELARNIQPVDEMSRRCKAGFQGLRAKVVMSLYQDYRIVLPYLHKAIELDPEFGYWPYLVGKVLRRARREFKEDLGIEEELKYFEKAVSLERNPKFLVFLAQAYQETAQAMFASGNLAESPIPLQEKAVELYSECWQMKNDSAAISRRVGNGMMKFRSELINRTVAEEALLKAAELSPNDSTQIALGKFYYVHEKIIMNAVERCFSCATCRKAFKTKYHLTRHTRSVHEGAIFPCPVCDKSFAREDGVRRHVTAVHLPRPAINPAFRQGFVPTPSPAEPRPGPSSIPDFEPRPDPSSDPNVEPRPGPSHASEPSQAPEPTGVPTTGQVCDGCGKTLTRKANMQIHARKHCKALREERQSEQPVRVQQQSHAPLTANSFIPLHKSSFIILPRDIAMKRAVINVYNNADKRCFEYAMLTKFIKNARYDRLTANHFTAEVRARSNLNFEGLEFPVKPDKIHTFERNNPGVSINVYGLDKKKKKKKHSKYQEEHYVYPLQVTDKEKKMHFDLLFLSNEKTSHYAYISNFSRLVATQLTRGGRRLFICKTCFAYFSSSPNKLGIRGAERLEEHKLYCSLRNPIHNKGRRKGLAHFFGPPPSASLPAQMFQPSPERPQQLAIQQQIRRSPSFGEAQLTSS